MYVSFEIMFTLRCEKRNRLSCVNLGRTRWWQMSQLYHARLISLRSVQYQVSHSRCAFHKITLIRPCSSVHAVKQQLFCRGNLELLILLFSTKLLLKASCINVLEFLLNDLFLSLLEYIHNKITAREIVRGFLPDF